MPKMSIESPSFENGKEIPKKHGYNFDNISPELIIKNIPKETKSLALIMDDPDAMKAVGKLWVHWIVWNIPPDTQIIKENSLPIGALQGTTDFGEQRYGGPAPPDKRHTYFIKLYALDKKLELPKNTTKTQLENTIKNHILEETSISGTFSP